MDPLSSLLALLKPRSIHTGRFDIGAKQAICFPQYEGIKCYAVITGQCWLALDGEKAILLEEGDCFLLPSGRSFSLSTDLRASPVDVKELLAALQAGFSGVYRGNPACTLAGGQFMLGDHPAELLLGFLPAVVHLGSESDKATMRWSMDRMREELKQKELGNFFIIQQLAYMMLVQALRTHLAQASKDTVGWLYAVADPHADPQIKVAITSMQEKPSHAWTVNRLAQHVGMSRSIFALKFKERVGESPMEHLTRWRMLLASDRLTASKDPILEIALSLGYESDSAFGKAFKRIMGCSPRQYSRESRSSRILRRGTEAW